MMSHVGCVFLNRLHICESVSLLLPALMMKSGFYSVFVIFCPHSDVIGVVLINHLFLLLLFPGQSLGDRNYFLWGERTTTCQRLCQRTTYVTCSFSCEAVCGWDSALLAPRFILRRLFLFAGDANLQISSLAEELARKTEDATRQQEEITHLLSQIVDLQKKAKLVWKFVMFRFSQMSYHIMTYKYQQI